MLSITTDKTNIRDPLDVEVVLGYLASLWVAFDGGDASGDAGKFSRVGASAGPDLKYILATYKATGAVTSDGGPGGLLKERPGKDPPGRPTTEFVVSDAPQRSGLGC